MKNGQKINMTVSGAVSPASAYLNAEPTEPEKTAAAEQTPEEPEKEIKNARITLLTYPSTAKKLQYIINKQAINRSNGEKKQTLSNVLDGLINQYISDHAAELEDYK